MLHAWVHSVTLLRLGLPVECQHLVCKCNMQYCLSGKGHHSTTVCLLTLCSGLRQQKQAEALQHCLRLRYAQFKHLRQIAQNCSLPVLTQSVMLCSASTDALRAAEAAQAGPSTVRNDPWSIRMREKYGLDTSQFTYNPESESTSAQPAAHNDQVTEAGSSRRCSVM